MGGKNILWRALAVFTSFVISISLAFATIVAVLWVVLVAARALQGTERNGGTLWSEPALSFLKLAGAAFVNYPLFSIAALFLFILTFLRDDSRRRALTITFSLATVIATALYGASNIGSISFFVASALSVLGWFGVAHFMHLIILKLGHRNDLVWEGGHFRWLCK